MLLSSFQFIRLFFGLRPKPFVKISSATSLYFGPVPQFGFLGFGLGPWCSEGVHGPKPKKLRGPQVKKQAGATSPKEQLAFVSESVCLSKVCVLIEITCAVSSSKHRDLILSNYIFHFRCVVLFCLLPYFQYESKAPLIHWPSAIQKQSHMCKDLGCHIYLDIDRGYKSLADFTPETTNLECHLSWHH